jgi:predicted nucleic acid-binding protein
VFIYAVEGLAPFATPLAALFSRFDSGQLHAVTSELTVAEVLVKPLRDGNATLCDAFERMLRTSGALTMVPVSRSILAHAAAVRATSSLKLPDAIHAATAMEQTCTTFLTNDRLFTTLTGLPVLHLPDLR